MAYYSLLWPTINIVGHGLLQIKLTSVQVFCCEYCETFNNTYFQEHLRAAAFFAKKVQKQPPEVFYEKRCS